MMEKAFQEGGSRKEEIVFVPNLTDIKLILVRSHKEGLFLFLFFSYGKKVITKM